MSGLPERERAIRQKLKNDFPHYAKKSLKIRPKKGGLIPLDLNRVQMHIHERLERQLAEKGRVRALILKARQPGCSTYVEGRYYWKVTHKDGVRAFILTHKQDATDNLFNITERYHNNCPEKVRPHTGKSNAKELAFDELDSGYKVGTAGTEGVGRSDTIQFFHGSEVAYWKNADDHMTGVLQAVPDEDDTEIILESTADGIGGLFYSMCKAAEREESEYILIFIPWHWHEEYQSPAPKDWKAPNEFSEYGAQHKLTTEQIYWAFTKNREMAQSISGDPNEICWKFRQEYPANAVEAFQTGGDKTFIKPAAVMKARKNLFHPDPRTPLIVGVDVARGGKDKTRIISRQGRRLGGRMNYAMDTDDIMAVAGEVANMIRQTRPVAVFIDITGLGAGVYDRMRELGYSNVVYGVNFGQGAIDPTKHLNKRAEMWDALRLWLDDPAGVDIPDDDTLHQELCAPVWGKGGTKYDSNSRLVIEAKEHIIERLGYQALFPEGSAVFQQPFVNLCHGLAFTTPLLLFAAVRAYLEGRRRED